MLSSKQYFSPHEFGVCVKFARYSPHLPCSSLLSVCPSQGRSLVYVTNQRSESEAPIDTHKFSEAIPELVGEGIEMLRERGKEIEAEENNIRHVFWE